jgi:hypothetical protein
VQNCIEDFQAEFPNFAVDYIQQFKKTWIKQFENVQIKLLPMFKMQNAPKTSNRQINLSVGAKHTLHKNLHFYHYYVTAVKELNPADYPRIIIAIGLSTTK